MAGIGFRLERLLDEDSYISILKSHIYSTFICSGPWLLSIITIFCLSYFAPKNIDIYEIIYFRATITYIFAFSLIITGVLYLSLSRYLADRLYLKDKDAMLPAFNSSILLTLIVQSVTGYLLFRTSPSVLIMLLSLSIYLVISLMWVIMIFLTSLRDYAAITKAYFAGALTAVLGALYLGNRYGLAGYLGGYLTGHMLIMVLLSARIFIEFDSKRIFDLQILSFLFRHRRLVFIGIAYNAAIWIDKIVFWLSPHAISISPVLRSYPEYESAVFFAYLTIIPVLTAFLISIETDFYKRYRAYYAKVMDKSTYAAIRQAKEDIVKGLCSSISHLLSYQGMITLIAITFAPELVEFFRLKAMMVPIFRIATLGAFLHSLLLITIIVILYFDFQSTALIASVSFLVTNGLFSFFTSRLDIQFLGYGYFFASLVSLIVAFYMLDFKLKRLEYITFASQPLGVHREEEIA